jgi:hypothetical protein
VMLLVGLRQHPRVGDIVLGDDRADIHSRH